MNTSFSIVYKVLQIRVEKKNNHTNKIQENGSVPLKLSGNLMNSQLKISVC